MGDWNERLTGPIFKRQWGVDQGLWGASTCNREVRDHSSPWCAVDTPQPLSHMEKKKREIQKTNKSVLLKALNDKRSQEAGCLHFVSIYGTQSLNRALHSEFIWLLKLPSKLLSARKPAAFKSFPVVSLYLETFHVGLIHWSILPCQNREWSVKNRMKLISGTQEIIQ